MIKHNGIHKEVEEKHKPRYLTLNGKTTHSLDPHRGVWYGPTECDYWTDDWAKVKLAGPHRIPVCPHCGAPGYQTTFAKFVNAPPKEHCRKPRMITSWMEGAP